jgi:undecaprenyl-diphosphatase
MIDLARWVDDPSRPAGREAWRDLGLRVGAPAVVWWLLVVGAGMLLTGPLTAWGEDEVAVNEWFVEQRTGVLNALTLVWGNIGTTETVIGICLIVAGVVWWRTKQWWYAVVPAIAVAVQASVFMLGALVVGRDRPDVPKLDDAPPTSSFPSGHCGASVALYLTLALMAQRIERTWLRATVTAVLTILPMLVAFARLYRGMHHVSDVIFGVANGLVCVFLGWYWLRRTPARPSGDRVTSEAAVPVRW